MAGMVFFFDFASPYAYAGFDATLALAAEAGLTVDLRPAMVWAILKAQDIPAPLDNPARRDYLLADMARSAAFFGLRYRQPDPVPISAHLAARMWLGFAAAGGAAPVGLARAIFAARFADGVDIRDPEALAAIAGRAGHDPGRAAEFMTDPACRDALRANVDRAVGLGVPGLPCVILADEMFFGADRLPQLRWRLNLPQSGGTVPA